MTVFPDTSKRYARLFIRLFAGESRSEVLDDKRAAGNRFGRKRPRPAEERGRRAGILFPSACVLCALSYPLLCHLPQRFVKLHREQ